MEPTYIPFDPTAVKTEMEYQQYYYGIDFYSEYQPNYPLIHENVVAPVMIPQTTYQMSPQLTDLSPMTPMTSTSTSPTTYSSHSSISECSASPSSSASPSQVNVQLPADVCAKVFYPPSAVNPSGHQRMPRRNKVELQNKRVHHCNQPGNLCYF